MTRLTLVPVTPYARPRTHKRPIRSWCQSCHSPLLTEHALRVGPRRTPPRLGLNSRCHSACSEPWAAQANMHNVIRVILSWSVSRPFAAPDALRTLAGSSLSFARSAIMLGGVGASRGRRSAGRAMGTTCLARRLSCGDPVRSRCPQRTPSPIDLRGQSGCWVRPDHRRRPRRRRTRQPRGRRRSRAQRPQSARWPHRPVCTT